MVSFLFWNLHKKPLIGRIAKLVHTHEIDVLILAECDINPLSIVKELNQSGGRPFVLPASESRKIRIITRFPESSLVEVFQDSIRGMTIRRLDVGEFPELLLVAAHLPSRLSWNRDDQTLEAPTIARSIIRAEDEFNHRRTILVGDLNMNPFDPGVVGAQGLNAVMTRDLARRSDRTVRDNSYRFFYNPMWGFFGDRTSGPAGSYYYKSSAPSNHYWNIYDQVLVRPELMDDIKDVRILESDGSKTLLTSGKLPNTSHASDHLPILFRLEL